MGKMKSIEDDVTKKTMDMIEMKRNVGGLTDVNYRICRAVDVVFFRGPPSRARAKRSVRMLFL